MNGAPASDDAAAAYGEEVPPVLPLDEPLAPDEVAPSPPPGAARLEHVQAITLQRRRKMICQKIYFQIIALLLAKNWMHTGSLNTLQAEAILTVQQNTPG